MVFGLSPRPPEIELRAGHTSSADCFEEVAIGSGTVIFLEKPNQEVFVYLETSVTFCSDGLSRAQRRRLRRRVSHKKGITARVFKVQIQNT